MPTSSSAATSGPPLSLPEPVAGMLERFREAAVGAFGDDLTSLVLYGSAAEGRLRATSDVNVILVLARFEPARADAIREPLRLAHAAVALDAMFVLEGELAQVTEAFAEKFADVARRRRVLHGRDVFASVHVSRAAAVARSRQVLLNLILRLRHGYVERSLREEQLARVLADAAGPLRSAAATLLELEGRQVESGKQALLALGASLGPATVAALETMSEARERRLVEPGKAGPALFGVMAVAELLRERFAALESA